jgi:protocatechuate 3,4-dioxygenase beta subunit
MVDQKKGNGRKAVQEDRKMKKTDPREPHRAASAGIVPTSVQDIGPYYPKTEPTNLGGDLTTADGRTGAAQGRIVYLSGRVLDPGGKPIPNARVEIWQANTYGRYAHPDETNPAPLDPNFEGHGKGVTAIDGSYRFKTVKPAAYPAASGVTRAPHIHFMVTAGKQKLITQMYFAGEPLNETDPLLGAAENAESLIANVAAASSGREPGALAVTWDIVLTQAAD